MSGARLPGYVVDGIRDALAAGVPVVEIQRKYGCSLGAVQHHAREMRKTLPHVVVAVRPHALPWVTKQMLTGRRAPIARAR